MDRLAAADRRDAGEQRAEPVAGEIHCDLARTAQSVTRVVTQAMHGFALPEAGYATRGSTEMDRSRC